MFKKNNSHLETSLFSKENNYNPRIRKMLNNTWANTFYEQVFRHIDESHFKVIYKKTGRANFPVNILVSLEILKELHDLTDEELLENYHFNYLYHKALGIEDINLYALSPRTLYYFRRRYELYERES